MLNRLFLYKDIMLHFFFVQFIVILLPRFKLKQYSSTPINFLIDEDILLLCLFDYSITFFFYNFTFVL